MKRKTKWFMFFLGLIILTLGGRLTLLAHIGTGGSDAFCIGLAKTLGGSFGLWIDIVSILVILLGTYIRRSSIQWDIVLTSILFGVLYDVWGIILFNRLVSPQTELMRGILFTIGILVGPLGASIYILSEISTGCIDYLMLAIRDRFHISLQASRFLIEGSFVVGAYIVGGPVGMGTILIMLLYGVILQFYYKGIINKLKSKRKRYV